MMRFVLAVLLVASLPAFGEGANTEEQAKQVCPSEKDFESQGLSGWKAEAVGKSPVLCKLTSPQNQEYVVSGVKDAQGKGLVIAPAGTDASMSAKPARTVRVNVRRKKLSASSGSKEGGMGVSSYLGCVGSCIGSKTDCSGCVEVVVDAVIKKTFTWKSALKLPGCVSCIAQIIVCAVKGIGGCSEATDAGTPAKADAGPSDGGK